MPLRDLSDTEAAYVAGIIDGEGTVTLTRTHRGEGRRPVVSISSRAASIAIHPIRRRRGSDYMQGDNPQSPLAEFRVCDLQPAGARAPRPSLDVDVPANLQIAALPLAA